MDAILIAQFNPYSEDDFERLLDRLDEQSRALAVEFGFDWNEHLGPGASSHSVATQVLAIARSGLFDAEHYLRNNPDIANLGVHALRHYVEYGDAEGRWPNAHFNPKAYRACFDAGALKSICSLYHYAVLGEALGIGAPPDFDGHRYLATHLQLQPWLDRPFTHYLHIGRHHGLALHHRMRLASGQRVEVKKPAAMKEPLVADENTYINVVGPLDKVSGLGVSARGYLQGLRQAGFKHLGTLTQPLAFGRQSNLPPDEFPLPPFIDQAPINVVHMNGDTLPLMLEHGGAEVLNGAHNIAVWYWELPVLRPEWYASLKYFDEFWAPTPFIANTLRAATAKPVTLLPPFLEHLRHMGSGTPVAEGQTPYFIYCFDANSILERKNPMALIEAFQQAFPTNSGSPAVELVMKVTYPDRSVAEVDQVYRAAEGDDRIRIVDDLLSSTALHTLIANALAYVSPHRSEGLGLTVIEAMAAGVPVITTAFSGLAPFVDDSTAWPVAFDLVELADEYHPYPKGFVWADPHVKSLAHQLHQVMHETVEVRERTRRARQRVLDRFSSNLLIENYRKAISGN